MKEHIGSTIPEIINAIIAIGHSFPEDKPMLGGKIRFPAPKNEAKSAKPMIVISL